MKLKKDDIKKARKILRGIDYFPVFGKSYIIIPIDTNEKNINGFDMTNVVSNVTNCEPGIVLWDDEDVPTALAYYNPAALVKFDLIQYIELTDNKLSKGDAKFLSDIDVYFINEQAIYNCMQFEYIKKKKEK